MMRFTVFDRWGNQTGVVQDVVKAVHADEVNGEDSLTLVTPTCQLGKGDRVVWRDKFGTWHEHIVNDVRDEHEGGRMTSTAYCENSMAEMFGDYIVESVARQSVASVALGKALAPTRWQQGTVDVTGLASATLYHVSAREAVSKVAEAFKGELSATITVSGPSVSSRRVNLQARRGADDGKRFEWTKDIRGVAREVATDDVCTALYGYGKGLEMYGDDAEWTGGYGRKLTFGSVNGGVDWIGDETAKQTWGLPDGSGGKKHAFGRAEFPDCEDPEELLQLTRDELSRRKVPQVSYTASVLDLADAGYAFEDVRAGDTVALVDDALGERLQGRVLRVERNLFNEEGTIVTLGNLTRTISKTLAQTWVAVDKLSSRSTSWDSAAALQTSYLEEVMDSLNDTMSADGGYTYMAEGEGITTYDRPIDQNPTKAIQIRGGGFRIANSKNSQGEWDWRTFGTGDGFAADLLNAGVIRGGSNYWNLNTGELQFSQGGIYDAAGKNYWNLTTGEFRLSHDSVIHNADGSTSPLLDYVELASATTAQAMVSKVTIGGTNLLNGTGAMSSLGTSSTWAKGTWRGASTGTGTRSVVDATAPPNSNIKRMFKLVGNGTNTDVAQNDVPMAQGEGYLLACYAKGKGTLRMLVGKDPYVMVKAEVNSSTWRRYYMRFAAGEGKASLSNGKANVYFGNCGTGTLYVCGMKLERGNKCTDWSASPDDEKLFATAQAEAAVKVAEETAGKKATDAINQAKTYTNQVSKTDREFSVAQRQALDASLNQAGVLKRLTNNYAAKGIYLKNGQLYMNGDYIRTGTLDAGIVRTGILSDKLGKNKWNMATGYLETRLLSIQHGEITGVLHNGVADSKAGHHIMKMQAGRIEGYQDGGRTYVGYIDFAANMHDVDTGRRYRGIQMQSQGGIRISSPVIAVRNTSSDVPNCVYGFTGTIRLNNVTFNMNKTMSSCKIEGYIEFRFINGIFVGLGDYNNLMVTQRPGDYGPVKGG